MTTENKFNVTYPQPGNSLRRLQLACEHCYERVLSRLRLTRSRIEREFGRTVIGYERLLNSAMNEAEALAWQTPYPHLFFPDLAEEKAVAVKQWAAHQRWVLRQPAPAAA